MLNNFVNNGVNISIKTYYLHNHLNNFPKNLGDLSEEQGKRYHQNIKVMEERYQGRWDNHMRYDYCCDLQSDCTDTN